MIHLYAHRCLEAASNGAIRQVIAAIVAACAARKVRLTPLRRHILELVAEAGRPVKAYELVAHLRRERGRAGPPTVYRSLDFLVEQGFVHKVSASSSYVFCRQPGTAHRASLLVCDRCGTVTEISADALGPALERETRACGFELGNVALEIAGVCADCRQQDR